MNKEKNYKSGHWSKDLILEYRYNEAKQWVKDHLPDKSKYKAILNLVGLGSVATGVGGLMYASEALAQSNKPAEVASVDSGVVEAINHLHSFDIKSPQNELNGNPGAIWTRYNCEDPQDANHYAIGQDVFVYGAGFDSQESFDVFDTGQPGGASCDPDIEVARESITTDDEGNFCVNLYEVQPDDCGEYTVDTSHVGGSKNDNYRVDEAEPTNTPEPTPTSTNVCPSKTPTPTATEIPTYTPTFTATQTEMPTQTLTPSPTATENPTPTEHPTHTPTSTNVCPTRTPTPTRTVIPSYTPTLTATHTETSTPSATSTATNTEVPTLTPTHTPTENVTSTPSPTLSETPRITETATSTPSATETPRYTPTETQTEMPTATATATQTARITGTPTETPTITQPTPTEIIPTPTETSVCPPCIPCPTAEVCDPCLELRRMANAQETSAAALAQKVGPEETMAAAQSTMAAVESTRIVLEQMTQNTPTPNRLTGNLTVSATKEVDQNNASPSKGEVSPVGVLATAAILTTTAFATERKVKKYFDRKIGSSRLYSSDFVGIPSIAQLEERPEEIDFSNKRIDFMNKKVTPLLPDKGTYTREQYFIPGTNRTNKEAKELFSQNWEVFNESIKNSNVGYDTKLELARDYMAEINNKKLADEELLKSMRRSFAARIGREKRKARLEGNLPKWEEVGYKIV